ncbi:MAG: phage tail tape measure protein [Clostridia bacterium]
MAIEKKVKTVFEIENKAYKAALEDTAQKQKKLGIETTVAAKKLEAQGDSSGALKTRIAGLTKQIELQKDALAAGEKQLTTLKKEYGENSEEVTKFATDVAFAENELLNMEKRLKTLNKQLVESGGKLGEVGDKVKKIGDKASNIGNKLSMSVTLPLVAAGTAATKFSIDFENAMAKVASLTGTERIKQYSEEILDLSDKTGIAAIELAEAQYQTISAGVDAAKSVEFLDTITKLQRGGFTEATTAVDGLTTVLNAYNLGTEKANEVGNYFIITQNLGKTTVDRLAKSIGTVVPTARAAGVEAKDLFAAFASLTAGGKETSASAAGVKAALSNILKPSAEAQKKASELGIEFSATSLKARGFAEFLNTLKETTHGNSEDMARLFGSTEALDTMLSLVSDNGAARFNDALVEMSTNTTALSDAFATVSDTTGVRLEIAINKVKNAGIQAGDALAPAMEEVADIIGGLADKFNDMSEDEQKAIVKTLMLVAAIAPIITIGGKLISGAGKLIKSLGRITGGLKKLNAEGMAMVSTGGWVGIAIAAIGVLTAVIIGAVDAAKENFRELNKDAVELNETIDIIKDNLNEASNTFEKSAAKTNATAASAESLVQRLRELELQGLRTKEAQTEYTLTVEKLNALIPELNLKIDAQSGKLDINTESLLDNISSWKERGLVQLKEQLFSTRITEYTNAVIAQSEAEEALNDKKKKRAEAELILIGLQNQANALQLKLKSNTEGSAEALQKYTDIMRREIPVLASRINSGDFSDAVIDELQRSLECASNFVTETDQKLETLGNTYNIAAKTIMGDAYDVGQALTDMGDTSGQALSVLEGAINTYQTGIESVFDSIETNSQLSADALLRNAIETSATISEFYDGMATLLKRGLPEDLLTDLATKGPQTAAKAVKELSEMTDSALDAWIGQWETADSGIKTALDGLVEDARTSGYNIGQAITQGTEKALSDGKSAVAGKARRLAQTVISEMKAELEIASPSKKVRRTIREVPNAAVIELEEGVSRVKAASKKLAQAANPEFEASDRRSIGGYRLETREAEARKALVPTNTITINTRELSRSQVDYIVNTVNRRLGRLL